MKNAHILLLYFLFSVLRQIGAEITQFATHRKLTLSFELFLFKNCSSGRNIIIKNCHKKVRKTEICAFSGSYCCSSARFRFSLFESYSGCILAFCRLQLYLEITFRCMEYMHFKDGDRYLYLYLQIHTFQRSRSSRMPLTSEERKINVKGDLPSSNLILLVAILGIFLIQNLFSCHFVMG